MCRICGSYIHENNTTNLALSKVGIETNQYNVHQHKHATCTTHPYVLKLKMPSLGFINTRTCQLSHIEQTNYPGRFKIQHHQLHSLISTECRNIKKLTANTANLLDLTHQIKVWFNFRPCK